MKKRKSMVRNGIEIFVTLRVFTVIVLYGLSASDNLRRLEDARLMLDEREGCARRKESKLRIKQ